jgi:hypothetical protein
MNDHAIEIVVDGVPEQCRADVADHVALALMSAGATVDFSARLQRGAPSSHALRGVRAVVRVGDTAQLHMLPGPEQTSFDAATAVRIAIGVVLLLVLFGSCGCISACGWTASSRRRPSGGFGGATCGEPRWHRRCC